MKKTTETQLHLINETNKNEIANDLIHCYEDYLVKIMKSLRGEKNYCGKKTKFTAEDIENFLKIIKTREERLNKLYKIA